MRSGDFVSFHQITRTDVQKATKEFLSYGGEIKFLPTIELPVPHYVQLQNSPLFENTQELFYGY